MAFTEYTAGKAATLPSTLIVAAHPDDAVLGAGAWAAASTGSLAVAFLTDGVPAEPQYFAPGFNDPKRYRATRRGEAREAWRRLRPDAQLHFGTVTDQTLAFHLPAAGAWINALLAIVRPQRVLVPAFEGGHPDHDAANRLLAVHAAHLDVWEYALYSVWHGVMLRQAFPDGSGRRPATPAAAYAAKRHALAAYRSQRATLASCGAAAEALRPLPRHDYGQPARDEPCVYERWGWPWRARDIATALAAYRA
jgi:LmbE family N-acetylglucosaminyl deacetylase